MLIPCIYVKKIRINIRVFIITFDIIKKEKSFQNENFYHDINN